MTASVKSSLVFIIIAFFFFFWGYCRGESSTCLTVYKQGGAPAVFQSPKCPRWNWPSSSSSSRSRTGESARCHTAALQGRRNYQEDRLLCALDLRIPFPGNRPFFSESKCPSLSQVKSTVICEQERAEPRMFWLGLQLSLTAIMVQKPVTCLPDFYWIILPCISTSSWTLLFLLSPPPPGSSLEGYQVMEITLLFPPFAMKSCSLETRCL